jgi:lysophospholipase L1-like esterase
MRMRRTLGRLGLAALAGLIPAALADAWLRTKVGACGVTPFATSTIDGLPHLLFAGRSTTYKGALVRINADGFRGEQFAAPAAGLPRIALIGDSVTFGNGCPEDGTLAAALAAELAAKGRAAQVLNCGIPGYNADNVATLLRARVLALQPTEVVWVLVANDVSGSPARSDLIAPDAVIDRFAELPLGSPLLQMANQNMSAVLRRMGFALDGYIESIVRAWSRQGGDLVRRALDSIRSDCAAAGVPFRVAVYPYLTRPDRNPFAPVEEGFIAACAERSIPVLPLVEAFARDENLMRHWVGPLDGHPDAAANRRVARLLAERFYP